jgi:hypothetical protein
VGHALWIEQELWRRKKAREAQPGWRLKLRVSGPHREQPRATESNPRDTPSIIERRILIYQQRAAARLPLFDPPVEDSADE